MDSVKTQQLCVNIHQPLGNDKRIPTSTMSCYPSAVDIYQWPSQSRELWRIV